jgi:hypothetical protein
MQRELITLHFYIELIITTKSNLNLTYLLFNQRVNQTR